MSQIQVTYNGGDLCTALSPANGKMLALDCPGTKGNEFSPGALISAGLAGCMLISMAKLAERRGLDVSGALLDVDLTYTDRPEKRIGTIDVTIEMPRAFSVVDRKALEKAAGTCPFKHSFRPDTEISTRFRYPNA